MFFVIPFPVIDPVLIQLGPFAVRWYALAYIAGLILGWRYCIWLAKRPPQSVRPSEIDDFLVWATIAIVLGGRLGYVLFYQPYQYFGDPLEILQLWHGGMSFHGGAIGVIIALLLFSHHREISLLAICDIVTAAVPIGLLLGRLANFVNAELYGRPTDAPWAMVFPTDPTQQPRHPSQLYEAGLEGIILFISLFVLMHNESIRRRRGLTTGVFLFGYAMARIFVEFFREPDKEIGYLPGGTTMGQWLSLPILIGGVALIIFALLRRAYSGKDCAS